MSLNFLHVSIFSFRQFVLDHSLSEHLRAHKDVPSLGHSFLYFIDFIHELHLQIINFVKMNVK